jgi:Ser/Thr protein kinase RdoA (MazF antagonist)
VLIRLSPAPVVARVMTGTVVLHDNPRRWLEREVSVLRFLSPSRVAVQPSPLIAAGPHRCEGLWMTFSEWLAVEHNGEQQADADELGRALRVLHQELMPFDGELGTLMDLREDIERLHRLLRPSRRLTAEMIAALRARLLALDDLVFRAALPAQALHGDVSFANLLHTSEGPVWNDFEDTFRGPVHWDLAGCVLSLQVRGPSAGSVRRALDAYGWADEQELAPFVSAHELYYEIWRLYDEQRLLEPNPP